MPLTTDRTLHRDLKMSILLREGVPVGLTWKGFKAAMTVLGVTDDDRIACIEFGTMQGGSGRIVRGDEIDGVEIHEI